MLLCTSAEDLSQSFSMAVKYCAPKSAEDAGSPSFPVVPAGDRLVLILPPAPRPLSHIVTEETSRDSAPPFVKKLEQRAPVIPAPAIKRRSMEMRD